MKVKFKWNKPIGTIAKESTGGDRTKLFMANEAMRLMTPYVPADNLVLAKNTRIYVEGGHGVVHYISVYAQYQYHGNMMVSKETGSPYAKYGERKVLNGRDLKYSKARHPLATSEWDKAMMTARRNDLIRAVQSYIGRGIK